MLGLLLLSLPPHPRRRAADTAHGDAVESEVVYAMHKPRGVVLKGCDLVVKRGPDARVRLKTHLSSAASSTVHKSNCRGASHRALDTLVDCHTGRRASRCATVNWRE